MKPKDIGVCEYKRVTDRETGKVFHVPTKKMSLFTQENIICAALNMGNADNLARLKDGWGWTDADIEKIKAKMSREDWEYVQGVWDLLDTMWPKIKKVHELMTGTTNREGRGEAGRHGARHLPRRVLSHRDRPALFGDGGGAERAAGDHGLRALQFLG